MKKIIHLIPYDGTGGVEVAARTMRDLREHDLTFSVLTIYADVRGYHGRRSTYGFRPLWSAFSALLARSPDLLIVSLWRACIVGILVKLVRPGVRLVLLLHSTRDSHWVDGMLTRLAARLADEWWADSAATLQHRIAFEARKPTRIISFVAHRLRAAGDAPPRPTFVFWGRLNANKGLRRAIGLLDAIRKECPDASFVIIGPDGGERESLEHLVAQLGLAPHVSFAGEMDLDGISAMAATASFYLQTSKSEGMAMSVVEAMQLGLVPVVTAVGEIANYCRNGVNAIVIESDEQAVRDVLEVLSDEYRYRNLQRAGIATWSTAPLYAKSVLTACRSALAVVPGSEAA